MKPGMTAWDGLGRDPDLPSHHRKLARNAPSTSDPNIEREKVLATLRPHPARSTRVRELVFKPVVDHGNLYVLKIEPGGRHPLSGLLEGHAERDVGVRALDGVKMSNRVHLPLAALVPVRPRLVMTGVPQRNSLVKLNARDAG
jgi:hypothetical protein